MKTTAKTRLLNLLIDFHEEAALKIIAKQDSRNMSETIRELIREEAKRRNLGLIGDLELDD
jgi:hypothetical protein